MKLFTFPKPFKEFAVQFDTSLSIIIPSKNEEKNMVSLLTSIQCQTIVSARTPIIVSDAHSTDNTRELIRQFKQKSGLNITVIDGGYPSKGRNMGAAQAKTEYLLFLDADIQLGEPETLAKVCALATESDAHLVVTNIRDVGASVIDVVFWKCFGWCAKWKLGGPVATGMFMFLKADVFRTLGGFDEAITLGEDMDLARKINPKRMHVADTFINITNRRFKQDGYCLTIYRYVRLFISKSYRHRDHRAYIDRTPR